MFSEILFFLALTIDFPLIKWHNPSFDRDMTTGVSDRVIGSTDGITLQLYLGGLNNGRCSDAHEW